ncbi:hypothetical protein Swit_4465 [Rhizorhabdus wittichii RW1]|uniref:Uncharacterized protein n=1 Tax=Rhizorhabdus wittichii (strain DSM 6014 / CCUG 31198 / JCM 15750 / NBRC 105917 / EY 4224 / RW1) TaxID=392499 RepID=A0A9J9LG72_RHIWR|nr:hypothetical protein Swit_4465 [Rhizorhabdus wittichii RW1]
MIPWGPIFKIGVPIALLIGLWLGARHVIANIRADERETVTAEFADTQQKREIADLRQALATERRQNDITEEANAKQSADLASANSRLAAYVARLRASGGGVGQGADLPRVPDAAGVAGGADRLSLLDADLRKCTAIAVRLGNAKDWAEKQKEVER